MNPLIRKVRDACILAQLVLIAGGGTAFFLFARVLFDRAPGFSEHPRYDAGEVVGPLVWIFNLVQIVFAGTILFASLARGAEPGASTRWNRILGYCMLAMLMISLAERFYLIPKIVDLRQTLGRAGFDGEASSPERKQFGMLHGIDNLAQLAVVLIAWAAIFVDRAATNITYPTRK